MKEEQIVQEDYESWKASPVTEKLIKELRTTRQDILEQFLACEEYKDFLINKGAGQMVTEILDYTEEKIKQEVA